MFVYGTKDNLPQTYLTFVPYYSLVMQSLKHLRRIELVVQGQDIIAGKVDPARIRDKRVFLEISDKEREFDMKKALAALNVMSKSGWKVVTYESTPRDMGFLLEKAF
jgi:hypothetical protein